MSKIRLFFKLNALIFIFLVSCNNEQNNVDKLTAGNTWGLDLSHHQGEIKWKELITKKPNFIYFKATEGISRIDSKYMQNKKMAEKYGILTGAYHFFNFKRSGKEQALFFCKIANIKSGNLYPVLDVEHIRKMPPKKIIIHEIKMFIETVKNKIGVTPIIYCDSLFYSNYLTEITDTENKFWICDYDQIKPSLNWTLWQKTDKFEIKGIIGTVDFNIFNGNKNQLNEITIN